MERIKEIKSISEINDLLFPNIDTSDLCAVMIGAIDAARVRGKSEGVSEVVTIIDGLKGRDGCVAVDVIKRVLQEKRLI